MTTGSGESAVAAGDRGLAGDGAVGGNGTFASDWQAVRADGDIQFAPVSVRFPEPEPLPQWLLELFAAFRPVFEFVAGLGPALKIALVVLAAIVLALIAWWLREPVARWLGRKRAATAEPEWQPDSRAATALLEDADRLAAEGRYDEATHLLLRRSVDQIAEARPGLIEPSSTAREIAALPALPDPARRAFAVIAARVERSVFALRRLSAEDWQAARAAYAEFALAAPRAAA